GESQQNIDHAAVELAVMVLELGARSTQVSARMDVDELAGTAQGRRAFVDEETFLPSDIAAHMVDPGGLIDQLLEGFASLDNVLQIATVDLSVIGVPLHIAVPFAISQWWDGVYRPVYLLYLLRSDGPFQNQVAAQIKQIVFHWCRHHRFRSL